MPQNVAPDLGLQCWPMSQQKDTRLIWVKVIVTKSFTGTDFKIVAFKSSVDFFSSINKLKSLNIFHKFYCTTKKEDFLYMIPCYK